MTKHTRPRCWTIDTARYDVTRIATAVWSLEQLIKKNEFYGGQLAQYLEFGQYEDNSDARARA